MWGREGTLDCKLNLYLDKKLPDGFVKFCINDIENNIDKARQNAQLVSGDQLFKGVSILFPVFENLKRILFFMGRVIFR